MKIEILISPPAGGKSTYCNFARESHGEPVVVSSDEARLLISGDENNQECSGRAFDFMRLAVEMLLRQNKNVIVDATNITKKARKDWVRLGRKYGTTIQMTVFKVPVDVCKARNARRERKVPDIVIESMAARFEEPTLEERDEILIIEG